MLTPMCPTCIVAAGSCVCNEANLTGEAMPVQKRQCPSDSTSYEVGGRVARHTLFSSTAVLQAGNSDSDEVLAVVSATGMTLLLHMRVCRLPAMLKHDCLQSHYVGHVCSLKTGLCQAL